MKDDMKDEQESPNPFAAPAVPVATIPAFDPNTEMREFNFVRSLGKWLLICFVCAAPSFFLGFSLGRNYVVQSTAMVMGILTYVALYVFVESQEWTRRKLMDKSLRIAVKVGYITRIVISVLFPISFFVDIWCGLISMSVTSAIFGAEFGPMRYVDEVETPGLPVVFLWFYFTTLLQGTLMNILLGGYTLVVYAFVLLFRKRPDSIEPKPDKRL